MSLYEEFQKSLDNAISIKQKWLTEALIKEGMQKHSECCTFEISDSEYKEKILPYWEKYGIKPAKFWFEMYGARDHIIEPRFIPDDIYFCTLIPYLNNLQFTYALEDKNYLDIRLPEVKQAETICHRISGEYYNSSMDLISEEEAIRLCNSHQGTLFIKESLYTALGKGVATIKEADHTEEKIRDIFNKTGANFIVQAMIKQHSTLAALCPDVVNTMRVITVFLDGRVTLTRFGLRIGLDGQEWISRYSGYYYASIYEDGTIDTRLQNEHGKWLSSEDIGLFGPGYKLPNIDQIISAAKRLHLKLPHFKIIGWDFTIDESGEPVLIEYNTSPGIMVQMTNCRPFFGDLTDRILDDYFIHRTLEKNQLQGLLVHP